MGFHGIDDGWVCTTCGVGVAYDAPPGITCDCPPGSKLRATPGFVLIGFLAGIVGGLLSLTSCEPEPLPTRLPHGWELGGAGVMTTASELDLMEAPEPAPVTVVTIVEARHRAVMGELRAERAGLDEIDRRLDKLEVKLEARLERRSPGAGSWPMDEETVPVADECMNAGFYCWPLPGGTGYRQCRHPDSLPPPVRRSIAWEKLRPCRPVSGE